MQKGGESLLAHVLGDWEESLEVIRVEVMELVFGEIKMFSI